jgi:hypothetical protein
MMTARRWDGCDCEQSARGNEKEEAAPMGSGGATLESPRCTSSAFLNSVARLIAVTRAAPPFQSFLLPVAPRQPLQRCDVAGLVAPFLLTPYRVLPTPAPHAPSCTPHPFSDPQHTPRQLRRLICTMSSSSTASSLISGWSAYIAHARIPSPPAPLCLPLATFTQPLSPRPLHPALTQVQLTSGTRGTIIPLTPPARPRFPNPPIDPQSAGAASYPSSSCAACRAGGWSEVRMAFILAGCVRSGVSERVDLWG